MRFTNRWEMPEVTFYQVEDHGFTGYGDRPMYTYGKPGETDRNGIPTVGEFYDSLDRALVSWVAERYTGRRGAGGTGVGTAADWFCRMIGMDQWIPISYEDHKKVMTEVLVGTTGFDGPVWRRTLAVVAMLEERGLTIAAKKDG